MPILSAFPGFYPLLELDFVRAFLGTFSTLESCFAFIFIISYFPYFYLQPLLTSKQHHSDSREIFSSSASLIYPLILLPDTFAIAANRSYSSFFKSNGTRFNLSFAYRKLAFFCASVYFSAIPSPHVKHIIFLHVRIYTKFTIMYVYICEFCILIYVRIYGNIDLPKGKQGGNGRGSVANA